MKKTRLIAIAISLCLSATIVGCSQSESDLASTGSANRTDEQSNQDAADFFLSSELLDILGDLDYAAENGDSELARSTASKLLEKADALADQSDNGDNSDRCNLAIQIGTESLKYAEACIKASDLYNPDVLDWAVADMREYTKHISDATECLKRINEYLDSAL